MKKRLRKYKLIKWNKNRIFALGIILIIVFVVIYILGQIFCKWEKFDETITTILSIIGAVAFWMEFKNNDFLNESQFIMELNNQFISNSELTDVEFDLESYFEKQKDGELTKEYRKEFCDKYLNNKNERQNLVNYLVHLEGIATIVNNGVLHLDIIDDLMAYRYFIAVNNPDVQKLELLPYKDFYKGCFDIYDTWKDVLQEQHIEIPMEEYNLTKER